jgi:WS/DGAT/MGAT family acyltransferase
MSEGNASQGDTSRGSVAYYEPLSNLDSSFLALETRTTHMHVAALVTFDLGPLRTAHGGVDITRVRRHIAAKLHLIPRYRMRLAHVPLERHPVWVDDEHFNLEYHVRHTSLPRPGGDQQLRALMGRLVSQQLDHAKPLWEIWVVEGISDDRFALISKVHHSMIDGISGVDMLAVLLSLTPDEAVADPEPFRPRAVPGGGELAIREAARLTGKIMGSMRGLGDVRGSAQALATETVRKLRAMGHSLGSGWLTTASDTPLNGQVGPNRRFGTLDIDLAGVKSIKDSLGGSVNDVVLAIVAGAVRRHLVDNHDTPVDGISFRVMAPVSVRSRDERGTLGNQVAMWLVTMPIDQADPVARLEAVRAETTRLKATEQALGAETLVRLSSGAPMTLVSLATRLASNARPFNMTVTNVPGPQFPLYLLGARMLATYPLVPLWAGHGAGIAIFSYAGTLYWGFNADWDVVADLDRFIMAVADSYEELRSAAAAAPPRRAPTKRRGPRKRPPMGKKPEVAADDDAASSAPPGVDPATT